VQTNTLTPNGRRFGKTKRNEILHLAGDEESPIIKNKLSNVCNGEGEGSVALKKKRKKEVEKKRKKTLTRRLRCK